MAAAGGVLLDVADQVDVMEPIALFFPKLGANGVDELDNQAVAQIRHHPIMALL